MNILSKQSKKVLYVEHQYLGHEANLYNWCPYSQVSMGKKSTEEILKKIYVAQ